MNTDNDYARWFGRLVLLGVAANICVALPTLLHPNVILDALQLPPVLDSPIWPSWAALLVLLLSAFCVPAAFDPERYRVNAYLAVVSRFASAWFFLGRATEYSLFGYVDLAFAVASGALLALYVATEGRGSPIGPRRGGEHAELKV